MCKRLLNSTSWKHFDMSRTSGNSSVRRVVISSTITMKSYSAKNLFSVALLLAISISVTFGSQERDVGTYPEVLLPQGNLRGTNIMTRYKRIIHSFKGIPFAQPPIGNLRFRAPFAAAAWNGTLNAIKDPNICLQVKKGWVEGSEDCLYINVYTPQLPSNNSKHLPVMVRFYGGAFQRGDSNEADPRYILDRDVLLVVPNYRLGPLGFLSTGDEVAPGNYGMKDQVLALKWIQSNIQYFGGDPNRVTIFGISSGAASVDLLALSDSTTGLFHRFIKMSGSSLSPRAYAPRATLVKHSYLLGEHLGCPSATSITLVNCMKRLNAMQIANTTSLFLEWNQYPDMVWRPTDEPDCEGAFMTDSPANLYAAGKIKDLPSISGIVRDEGLYYTASFYEQPKLFDEFLERIDTVLPYVLLYQDREDVSAYTAALKSYYLNDLTADKNVLLANLTQLVGDVYYIYPTYSAHQKQFALGNSRRYLYSFEYLTMRTFKYTNSTAVAIGIQHADDETFLFPINSSRCELGLSNCQMSESDLKISDAMVELWTSFAINGTPTLSWNNVTWSSYSTEDNYLRIGHGPDVAIEVKYSFLKERMDFWNELTASHSRS